MPLVRFQVKNEYALGGDVEQLYRGESSPKAILDGVAVAGFVGILRQLGDLAEFAADIFQDLHEQVKTTSARARKMMNRIEGIETALPSLEKAIQAQSSYIHFAYIAGSDWHANVRTDQSRLLGSDLPQFMIDFYEECHDPPRLYLLDKYDSSGAGACLKRYSDPTYFKRALASLKPVKVEKFKRKKKKRGPRLRNEGIQQPVFSCRYSNSTQFATSSTSQPSFSGENPSVSARRLKSDPVRGATHSESEIRSSCVEDIAVNNHENSTAVLQTEPKQYIFDDDSQPESLQQQSAPRTSSVTWDEKTEIVKSTCANLYDAEAVDMVQDLDSLPQIFETSNLGHETEKAGADNQEDIVFELARASLSYPCEPMFNEVPCDADNIISTETDNIVDVANILELETKSYPECPTDRELKSPDSIHHGLESGIHRLTEASATNSYCFDAQTPCNSSDNSVVLDGFDHVQSTNCQTSHSESTVENSYSKSNIPSEFQGYEQSPDMSIATEQDVLVKNKSIDEISTSQDSPANTSNIPSVTFWTNGGILGLEPSKPPDFSADESKSRIVSSMVASDKSNDLPPDENSKGFLQSPTSADLSKNQTDTIAPGSDLTAIYNTVSISGSSDKNSTGNSTSFSGIAQKFLSNSIQRKFLVANAGLSTSSQLMNSDFRKLQEILRQNYQKELPTRVSPNALCELETEEKITVGSSEKPVSFSSPYYGSSSPPLEHMNISFNPINPLDASKLKLDFSSGDLVLPSFQLIPGNSTSVQESSSESDDDTFCRSSVYSSDDHFSSHAESNSELWGEDERSESQKHRVSDDSCTDLSLPTSACGSMKFEQVDESSIASELEHLEVETDKLHNSIRDLNLANSDTYEKSKQQEICEPINSSDDLQQPPLPPLQWRVVKEFDKNHSGKDINSTCMKVMEHLDAHVQCFPTHKYLKPDVVREPCNADVARISKEADQQILIGNGANPNYNNKEQDGRGDLLHQIRSKSFNLRRTITSNPSHTAVLVTDINSAIMKKDHISQQVISYCNERRDDDNWSEG